MARLLDKNLSDPTSLCCHLSRPLVFAILSVVVTGILFLYKTKTYAELKTILEYVLMK